jgi:hypothetical protein
VSNERGPDDKTRAPDRKEFEEARRLNTDLKAIRNTILDCWQQSDNGNALKAALGAHGLMLANGDRRDCFVVVDQAGGQHALNKKLTGLTLAETRNRLGDLDRAQLPSVEAAKVQQHVREAAREARQSERAMQEARAGVPEPSGGTQRRPEPEDMRPLGKTAGEIRTAWTLSRSSVEQLDEALAARGMTLAAVSAEDARQSERAAAFAKEVGNHIPILRAGEIVVVDNHGAVSRLTERTTGDTRAEIEARLGGIDRLGLLTVANAQVAMREADREAWKDADRARQDMERPLTGVETTIAEALKSTMTGTEFAAALDEKGLTIARATEADLLAMAALRQDEQLGKLAAEVNLESRKAHHYGAILPGDFAAITRGGDVFRLNPTALDWEEVEQRLADTQLRMPGVVEVRALQEINREQTAERWEQRRAENLAAREAFEDGKELRGNVAAAESAVDQSFDTAASTVDQGLAASSGFFKGAAKLVEMLGGLLDFLVGGGPKLTPHQAELEARAAEEKAEVRAQVSTERATEAAYDWIRFERSRQEQQEDLTRSQQLGGPATREANTGREQERDRGGFERD